MISDSRIDTDIEVLGTRTTFTPIDLDHPLVISGRTIAWFTLAVVEVDVRNRLGDVATGRGATILSVPWAWPRSDRSVEQRDRTLRDLTTALADQASGRLPTDPLRLWLATHDTLADTVARVSAGDEDVPALATMLALGAVDNAVHDGWARAAGLPAHTMYTGRYLHDDLGALVDPALAGRWPGEFLVPPRSRIEVQHLIGASDPLEPADADAGERSLREWLTTDGVRHLKVKVHARDVEDDARRIAAVYRLARELGVDASLAIDPNEGYVDPSAVTDLLGRLLKVDDAAAGAVTYIEQPVSRDRSQDPTELTRAWADAGVPVVMDEGLVDPRTVPGLAAAGWGGIVIKAGKGHSAAILAHAAAKAAGLYVTVQDLTAVDLALLHSARLVSLFDLPSPHLEYNSRQYAPAANGPLGTDLPELTTVRDGAVTVPAPTRPGLY